MGEGLDVEGVEEEPAAVSIEVRPGAWQGVTEGVGRRYRAGGIDEQSPVLVCCNSSCNRHTVCSMCPTMWCPFPHLLTPAPPTPPT
jgi:hypothetical protein